MALTDSVRTAQKTDGGGEDDVIMNEVNGDASAEKVANQEEAMEEGGHHLGHFHKKGQITVKTRLSIFNPVGTRYMCIWIDMYALWYMGAIKNKTAYNLYYY